MSTETVDQAITRVVDGRVVPATGTYVLDKAHTKVTFVARHLMVTKVRGHFPDFDGTIEVAENPADSKVTAEIRMASVTTDDANSRWTPADERLLRRRALPDDDLFEHEDRAGRRPVEAHR